MKAILSWLCVLALVGAHAITRAQNASESGQNLSVREEREGSVTIHFGHPDGAINYHPLYDLSVPMFRAMVGGEEVCATVDTGANQIVISTELAARLGLGNILSIEKVRTPSRATSGFVTSPVEVEVPSQFRFEASLVASSVPELICPGNLKLELLLGMPAFGSMTVFVDHPNKRIAFLPGGQLPPVGSRNIKIPWVDNRITGTLEGQTVSMMLDTGVNEPMLVKDIAWDTYFAGKAVMPAEPIRTAGGVIIDTVKVEDANLVIERATITARALRYPDTGWATPVVLGYAFFTLNPFIFDASGEAIYMLPNEADK